jgi:hypothetical protein
MEICPWCNIPMNMDPSGIIGSCSKCHHHIYVRKNGIVTYTNAEGNCAYPPTKYNDIEAIEKQLKDIKKK